MPRGRSSSQWDALGFSQDVFQAKSSKDWDALKKHLAKVADHNYQCREFWTIPKTVPVSFEDCCQFEKAEAKAKSDRGKGKGKERPADMPQLSISTMTTAEACQVFAKDRQNVVCALNFANGSTVGGGYKNGATAQEEDLCRQFPTLYSTLYNASKDGLYPFGPSTCRKASEPAKYSDVLYTSALSLARGGMEEGYPLLEAAQEVQVSMVAAAAPNIRFAKEIADKELIYNTIKSIFIAPQVYQPEVNTLILGAFGCGAFGNDPTQMAELFVRALMSDNYGGPYKEIHFAIPKLSPEDQNYEVFARVFSEFSLQVKNLDEQPASFASDGGYTSKGEGKGKGKRK